MDIRNEEKQQTLTAHRTEFSEDIPLLCRKMSLKLITLKSFGHVAPEH